MSDDRSVIRGQRELQLELGHLLQTSPDGVHTCLETLLLGTGWTLATALSAWCLALAVGSLVGVIRTTPKCEARTRG